MKFIVILTLFSLLASCGPVRFNQPQPKNGIRLSEFPEELMRNLGTRGRRFLHD